MDRLQDVSGESGAARAASELRRAADPPSLREAASRFEAYLLGQIFSQAGSPLTKQPLLDSSSASRMYRELYIQEVASHAGPEGGLGIARLLEAQAGRAEAAAGAAPPAQPEEQR